ERRPRRHGYEGEEAVEVIWSVLDPAVPGAHHFGRAVERPEHRPPNHGADWMEPEGQRGDDAEVAAAAADRPEEVAVLLLVGGHKGAVGENDVSRDDVVDREPVLPGEVADAAPKREPHPGRGEDSTRRRESEGMRRVVDVPKGATALDGRKLLVRVDADALQQREVEHDPVVDDREPGRVVHPAANGQQSARLAREV